MRESKPLESATWGGAVDTVGGEIISTVISQLSGNSAVASCGNVAGIKLNTNILPFILRGVSLLGIDSVHCPYEKRKEVDRDVHIDESLYTKLSSEFENTYFNNVYKTLKKKFKLGRVRLLLKEPRSTLSWHKDPEPRLHIPIITNLGCSMVIENVAKHLPADGHVTITNNTKYHNFFNGGEQSRIHLVACVLENPFN